MGVWDVGDDYAQGGDYYARDEFGDLTASYGTAAPQAPSSVVVGPEPTPESAPGPTSPAVEPTSAPPPDVRVKSPTPAAPSGPSSSAASGGSGSEGGDDYTPDRPNTPSPAAMQPQAYAPMSPIMDIGAQSVALRAPYLPEPMASPVQQYAQTGGGARLGRRSPEVSGGAGLLGNQLGLLGDTRLYGGHEDFDTLIPSLIAALQGSTETY